MRPIDRLTFYGFITGAIILLALVLWFLGPMDSLTAPWLGGTP